LLSSEKKKSKKILLFTQKRGKNQPGKRGGGGEVLAKLRGSTTHLSLEEEKKNPERETLYLPGEGRGNL